MKALRKATTASLKEFFNERAKEYEKNIFELAQKRALESIITEDLKLHMDFLASDELEGRSTGEKGLEVAARYLAGQAEHTGLKPMNGELGFFQYYSIEERTYDWEKSGISIISEKGKRTVNKKAFYLIPGIQNDRLTLEGQVVFAGYGINDEAFNYNDFSNIDISDKIVMIMNRAPMNAEGTECKFGSKYMEMQNFQYKMQNIMMQGPKAILMVFDPKSGMNSIEDLDPGISKYLSSSISLKKEETENKPDYPRPRMILVHRDLADHLLENSGTSLEKLQAEIDESLEPGSFQLEGIKVEIDLIMKNTEHDVPNVFGVIEGSDPLLKNEFVIYLAHFDHIGTDGEGGVFNGADDNASGSVALIEIADAYMKEKNLPERSVGFLWVSGEEIGLFGSGYFADHSLVPIENIAAVINLDMVGRTKTDEDRHSDRDDLTIVGGDTVGVLGGLQSKLLMDINTKTLNEMGLIPDYTYNNLDHPARFFYRSDHINFARKDIPVLFYSTGTHADYHRVTDDPGKIDYDKFLTMTKFAFKVGFNVANYKGKITVDNPMSKW